MFSQFRQNLNKYDRAILIIRNPLDAFIAYMNWRLTFSHIEHGSYNQWMEIDIEDLYLNNFFTYWKKFHQEILDQYLISNEVKLNGAVYNELHMVEYAKLRADLIGEVTNIVNFLGLPMTSYIKACLLKNSDGFHKRLHNISWTDSLIEMGKIDQSLFQMSKLSYEEFVLKFKQKLNKI